MGITTLDVVLPNPDKISKFKDPLLKWEKVDNARTPSWRRDLLLEIVSEEEELDDCEHKLKEVTSDHCLAVVYSLCWRDLLLPASSRDSRQRERKIRGRENGFVSFRHIGLN